MKTIVLAVTLVGSLLSFAAGAYAAGIPKKPVTSQSGIAAWAVGALGETPDAPF